MARPRRPFPAGFGSTAKRLMQASTDADEYRRLQAVYLAAAEELPNEQIARQTGLSINTVRMVHVRVRRAGVESLVTKARGGRFREHLTKAQEQAVLDRLLPQASAGGVVVVSEIQAALEAAAGRTYHLHSIYRLLARRGWRKVAPRRRHPDHDPAAAAAFKKSGRTTLPTSPRARASTDVRAGSSSRTKPASDGSTTRAGAGRRRGSDRSSRPSRSANTPISSPPSTRSPGSSPPSSTPM